MTTQTTTTPASVHGTHGQLNTPAPVALDLCLGDRPATRCGGCNRHLDAIEPGTQRFELEDANTGDVYCDVCSNRRHHPLRLAVALLNSVVEAYNAGERQQAADAIGAVINGAEMLREAAPRTPYVRPVRQQPRRAPRRGRRR